MLSDSTSYTTKTASGGAKAAEGGPQRRKGLKARLPRS